MMRVVTTVEVNVILSYDRFTIQRHLDKSHSDVEDRARYLVDLVNEWPEYYELRKRQEV